jgi:hypothetical protein
MKYLNPKQRTEFIQKINKEIIRRDIFSSTSTFKKDGAKTLEKLCQTPFFT